AALPDQVERRFAGNDLVWFVGRSAEHAHRVVVGKHHVPDWFGGDLAHALDDFTGHERCGLRIDDHDAVIADDHTGVWVAFGSERIGVPRKLLELDLLG